MAKNGSEDRRSYLQVEKLMCKEGEEWVGGLRSSTAEEAIAREGETKEI